MTYEFNLPCGCEGVAVDMQGYTCVRYCVDGHSPDRCAEHGPECHPVRHLARDLILAIPRRVQPRHGLSKCGDGECPDRYSHAFDRT